MKKERLDKILTDRGLFETQSKAAAAILAGNVKINEEVITKAGFQIVPDEKLNIEIKSMPYVSRGGFKLEKAVTAFNLNVKDRVCFDAGASTGGFTDVLLQNGAKFVYAVDVGYGQIAWRIRQDERVKVIERTNIKTCMREDIYQEGEVLPDLLVMDVSFISIEKILPNLKTLLNEGFQEYVCLIKPQFEAGKELVEKGGVVRDKNTHYMVINNVLEFVKNEGFKILNLTYSAIKGPSGNIEYLIHFATSVHEPYIEAKYSENDIKSIIAEAFEKL